ncbi:flexible cuticle protein 12-like [Aricia agestis]|uniref:flexible cuticle protein 12-like n=1 Tax=Aricia agestis TaxID=91739 RepID=UPI001C2019BA|nr:flexible cuticle protein 12-like [Aricia agestis]
MFDEDAALEPVHTAHCVSSALLRSSHVNTPSRFLSVVRHIVCVTTTQRAAAFIVLAVLVAAALAGPVNPNGEAVILRYDADNNAAEGGYQYLYETSNGILAHEEARSVDIGTEVQSLFVQGEFQYVAPDGVTYRVTYTADKDGFHPLGDHIPQA